MTPKTSIRLTVIFPIVYLTIGLIGILTDNSTFDPPWFPYIGLLIICLVVWGIGLLLALVISLIYKKNRLEPWLYIGGQSLLLLTFVGIVFYSLLADKIHSIKYGNIEANHSLVQLDNADNDIRVTPKYVSKAFLLLESKFPEKNSFRVTEYFIRNRDSLAGSYTDTLRTIYFTYKLANSKIAFSKVEALEDTVVLKLFNADPMHNSEYKTARKAYLTERYKMDSLVHKALFEVPDSIKDSFPDEFK